MADGWRRDQKAQGSGTQKWLYYTRLEIPTALFFRSPEDIVFAKVVINAPGEEGRRSDAAATVWTKEEVGEVLRSRWILE